jgi:uncharacterized protein (TIGR04255 family)
VIRPEDLPEFDRPPLNEVVIGVQFAPARGYSQIRAGEVWSLFKSDFPIVEEHPPLAPTFELFGRPLPPQASAPFVVTGAFHNRFWFLTPGKEELIQFQPDRLLHNWRKVRDENNEYPRYERMIEKFERELRQLDAYFTTLSSQPLAINQCEISYINHIPCDPERGCVAEQWFQFLHFGERNIEDFAVSFRRIVPADDGRPIGRLTCEATTALALPSQPLISLTLTARGAPDKPGIPAALAFLARGREIVVRTFTEITTESAHQAWQRSR